MVNVVVLAFSFLLAIAPNWPHGMHPAYGDPLIIVNKATNTLAFFNEGKRVMEVPVATGKTNELTPEGVFTVTVKAKDPYYRKKDIPGGDPRNPLGPRWIGFDAKGTDGRIYGIHGTNRPESIGHYISNGCIRMNVEAVKQLYDLVPIGTKVLITHTKKGFWQLAKEMGVI